MQRVAQGLAQEASELWQIRGENARLREENEFLLRWQNAALALEAGVPAGCFSVVTGAQDVVGGALTASPLIRKLSFTGSTGVGRTLAAQCAPTLKRLSMELGGAAPLLVFAYVLTQPKPKPVRIRARDAERRRGPHA